MDENKAAERQYESATIDISSSTDFGALSNIKTIEETELQGFLMDDPIISSNREEPEKIVEETPKKAPVKKEPVEEAPNIQDYFEEGEEEVKPTKQPKKEVEKENTSSYEEDENTFTILNRDLIKANIFGEDEGEEIKDAQSFKDKFIHEMQKGANSIVAQYANRFGPKHADAFEAIFEKGVDPEIYYAQAQRIDQVEGLDIKDPDVQEQIMSQYFASQGLDKDKIKTKVQKLKDYGDLEEDAERVHSIMVREEKRRLAEEEEAAEEHQMRITELKRNYHINLQKALTDKIKAKTFNGLSITPDVANRVFHNLTADAYRMPNGQVLTEYDNMLMQLNRPENIEKKIMLNLLLENDFDFSKIKHDILKKENNDIFEGLQRQKARKKIEDTHNQKSFF
jgi:hypothetical protein